MFDIQKMYSQVSCLLVQRIEDGFIEIDNDILVDSQKQDEGYLVLCRQIRDMEGAIRLY
ncbi:MAG: hypothetical protein HFI70_16340 [Lachnospiraceae bacterium]|nr:hypothetical protein [Lachnospiraceae bacterium]